MVVLGVSGVGCALQATLTETGRGGESAGEEVCGGTAVGKVLSSVVRPSLESCRTVCRRRLESGSAVRGPGGAGSHAETLGGDDGERR